MSARPMIPVQLAADVMAHMYLRAGQTEPKALAASETQLHAVADAHLKKVMVAVKYAFALGRKALRAAPAAKRADAAARAVRAALLDVLPDALAPIAAGGANVAVKRLKGLKAAEFRAAAPAPVKLTLAFNAADPRAVEWAKQHAAELAQGISDTTRDDIKAAIADALESGDAGEAEDTIAEAVGDDARAELIARTEIMSAANEGQRMGWDAAVEHGLLDEDARRVWIATDDACDDCQDLDGQETDLDGEYPDDGGDGPPLHPNCRCTEGIVG